MISKVQTIYIISLYTRKALISKMICFHYRISIIKINLDIVALRNAQTDCTMLSPPKKCVVQLMWRSVTHQQRISVDEELCSSHHEHVFQREVQQQRRGAQTSLSDQVPATRQSRSVSWSPLQVQSPSSWCELEQW